MLAGCGRIWVEPRSVARRPPRRAVRLFAPVSRPQTPPEPTARDVASHDLAIHDLAVLGGGASGMVAAIAAARRGRKVLLLEKSRSLGRKLLASGGERCNLGNTLSKDEYMERFGRQGRFMGPALDLLGQEKLREFFHGIGVKTVVLDGFRVWPETRKSTTVLAGLVDEMKRLGVAVAVNCTVERTSHDGELFVVEHPGGSFRARELVVATGGLALPKSGASGGGYAFAESFGHSITPRFPAGVPLVTAEDWPAGCTAHTIGKAHVQVAIKKHAKIQGTGDLIFTNDGIRGPVVLDMSREISALLDKHGEVPLWLNLCRGRNQEDWRQTFKQWARGEPVPLIERLGEHLPREVAEALCAIAGIDPTTGIHQLEGAARDALILVLDKTPLTVTGTTGYDRAFVTRGGVKLKEVRSETLESKLQPGLYLCGEVLDLDGPCGGFNLQWAFASGFLAGQTLGSEATARG